MYVAAWFRIAAFVLFADTWSMQVIAAEVTVDRWMRFEQAFTSEHRAANPVQDVEFGVEFRSPSGATRTVAGFWDGEQSWKVRFSPDELGLWTYRTFSRPPDGGLDGKTGSFRCTLYRGTNPVYAHGPLRLSEDRRYLIHADGTPFFWLGDTAWNGPLKADEAAWNVYLSDRQQKHFTGIQFVTTQWIAAGGNADLRVAFENFDRIGIVPEFFRWMDARIDAINDHGMIAAPALIWDTGPAGLSPGVTLDDQQIIVLARYMVARYGAHQVIWILNGDGDYRGEKSERWKRIGRAVFGDHPDRLVTLHPAGRQWVADEFRNEPWFGFNSYQSSHGDDAQTFRWMCEGPPSQDWRKTPVLPSINLEPNYEAHNGFPDLIPFDAHAVRRAAYWSLLVAPPAGVSYGAHGVWSWELTPQRPMNHPSTGVARPWNEAIHLPGSTDMLYLKRLFDSLPWWTLRPAQQLLAEQPGAADAALFVMAARSEKKDWALLYAPAGGEIRVRADELPESNWIALYNPREGVWKRAIRLQQNETVIMCPDRNDWIVWIGVTVPAGAVR